MRDTRRARLILGLLLAASLVLITVDHRQREDSLFEPVRSAAASVFGIAERAGAGVVRPVGDFIGVFTSAPDAKRQIALLREENSRMRRELATRALDRLRSGELARVLGLSGLGGYHVVPAQVIARRGVPGFEDAVEIDAGARDGVRSEMTVLNGDGLVGRVVHTGPATATVVLLTDPASSAGARVEDSNEIGVATGLGPVTEGRLIRFRLLDSAAPLTAGRRIVSFGSQNGTPYAPGLPVGTIERVEATPGELTRVAYARPFVDFTALDIVGVVVRAPQRDPRDAMLPPPPRAAKPAAPAPRVKAPPVAPSMSPSSAPARGRERGEERGPARGRGQGAEHAPSGERARDRRPGPASGARPAQARGRPASTGGREGPAGRPAHPHGHPAGPKGHPPVRAPVRHHEAGERT